MSEARLNLRLPSASIRRIVRLNAEVLGMNAEGVAAISKLTEQVPYRDAHRLFPPPTVHRYPCGSEYPGGSAPEAEDDQGDSSPAVLQYLRLMLY